MTKKQSAYVYSVYVHGDYLDDGPSRLIVSETPIDKKRWEGAQKKLVEILNTMSLNDVKAMDEDARWALLSDLLEAPIQKENYSLDSFVPVYYDFPEEIDGGDLYPAVKGWFVSEDEFHSRD